MAAPAFPAGKLEVRILKAKDLKNMDTFGKMDPYVKVTPVPNGVLQKTKVVKKGGCDPDFQEVLMFETDGAQTQIKVEVCEHDKLKDDYIGLTHINLADISAEEEPKWYDIETRDGGANAGQVLMAAKFTPYVAGQLYVEVIKGQDLVDKDLGKQDPYVKIAIDGKQEKKTVVIKKGGKNPEWEDQKFAFEVQGNEKWLTFRVMDEDLGGDDFVGGNRTDLRKLNMADKKDTGEMVLKLGQGDHYDQKKEGNLIVRISFEAKE